MTHIAMIVGARPNFMKAAPVLEALRSGHADWESVLIHTGQHYDEKLSDLFFHQLRMPEPDINLNVGSSSHATQTARIMVALEDQFIRRRPDLVIVYGDVNSTLAAAVVAAKLCIPLAHVEAGLRSFDRSMPEEINRIMTDAVSDILFVTEPAGRDNLRHEGVKDERIFFVGNTMIDTLLKHKERAQQLNTAQTLGVSGGDYVVVTLHRPSNVDDLATLTTTVAALEELARSRPVIFPVHPRTHGKLQSIFNQRGAMPHPNLHLIEPQGYLEFISLLSGSAAVITDSGGVQEETTILRVPCITLRNNTERPITLTRGTNQLVGTNPQAMLAVTQQVLAGQWQAPDLMPELWDGAAAQRIVRVLEEMGF